MLTKIANIADCMYNRELSWLKFNERVLHEANRRETPLIERLKFISIYTSNLDEFYMIRVGALSDYVILNKKYRDNKTGMTPQEQLDEVFRATAPLYALRDQAYSSIRTELAQHGVHLPGMQDLDADELKTLKNDFMLDILPMLSPQIIDSRHPFPHLTNKQLHIAVMLEKKRGFLFGLIAIPASLSRLVKLGNGFRFVLLEDIVLYFSDLVFSGYKVLEKNIMAVTRNADIDVEDEFSDEGIDYRVFMKNILKKRQRLSPVRLELMYPASGELLAFFCKKLSLDAPHVFYSASPLDLSFGFSLNRLIDEETSAPLVWRAHTPAEALPPDKKANMVRYAASGRDFMLSYPFDSMSPFLSMIRQSAEDASVLSIKITLYRIDTQSKLAESLILAAENGKEVVVIMELRARFDERNNIEWAQRLEEAGCRVIYGLVGYKIHSKVCLITQRESGKIRYITQIGTGNYNEKTAKQYTDLSLITANQVIGHDAAEFFSNLQIGNLDGEYKLLWVAPGSFKKRVLECIEEERQKSANGGQGSIIIKCNSLTDREIIEKLVEASCDGVEIQMIIRGICCLVPQMAGLTGNIRVVSIVGKFLEHSRIFCFGKGSEKKIYISSADLMTRNTERRVEVACPILDAGLKEKITDMLDVMLRDNTQAWEEFSDARYILRTPPGTDLIIDSQEIFTKEALSRPIRMDAKNTGMKKNNGGSSVVTRALTSVRQFFKKRRGN